MAGKQMPNMPPWMMKKMSKEEKTETSAKEKKESPAKQKAEKKAGVEKKFGRASKANERESER